MRIYGAPGARLSEALRNLREGDAQDKALADRIEESAKKHAHCKTHGPMDDPWPGLDQHGVLMFLCRDCNIERNDRIWPLVTLVQQHEGDEGSTEPR